HSVHPTGVEEFSTGALVGPNARLGRSPGDLASTDPLGKIMQPYSQSEPAAGFLLVQVDSAGNNNPAKLTFTFYSENGAVFYQNTKLAAQ
ncbi:MAG: Alkaline phosphatase precursor, partial [Pseudomonadota bacterium]